ncbi:MAG: hypothetical protein ACJ789_15640 [Thermomicrobiales bacterium]
MPRLSTSPVGRARERTDSAGSVTRRETQLLTLTSSGDVGKTRLAIQRALDVADQFQDDVTFVGLSAVG